MGKIYCMMGKSSTGKDTLYKMLLEDGALSLKKIIPYTTRPMRRGETDGVEYYFCGEKELADLLKRGKVIELRAYDTVQGVWKYFTVDDHQIQDLRQNYLLIGTLEAYGKLRTTSERNVLFRYILKWRTESGWSVRSEESGSSGNRTMKRCAGDFWRTRQIFGRKAFGRTDYGAVCK